ncbi:RimK/LysX family protein [Photobacterium sp. DNB23_23_1]|uniref:RimK/LysX family protein n=1 Tax=Photobacterium pectinilyticum TaxID=2906793 RepID=A0ABT1N6F1_9GAMM|nr:RimK/LysX family protein [Photobacterium sp. ZSDE20]MCQ1060322.1 RimK/LysX family protein [Photobacterium sp. ZSDE20]MDD1828153.1 RimK/LysX family protein [Photobacterium sp. ZSDE20]
MTSLRLLTSLCLAAFAASPALAKNTQYESIIESRAEIDNKVVLGRTELVYFPAVDSLDNIGIPAKIDTGADSTSIHAENITITTDDPVFKGLEGEELLDAIAVEYDALGSTQLRDRKDKTNIMVNFDIRHPHSGELIRLEKPLFRLAMIKSRGDGHLARPVVKLDLTIAGQTVPTEVNLANRDRFSYPILIGKTFLRNTAWVDAGFDYLQAQSDAQIIGRKEHAKIENIPLEVSTSFDSRYSILHALDIKVDEKKKTVRFTLEGRDKTRKTITAPLSRMLSFSNAQRPMVYLPVTLGGSEQYIQVYLKDRTQNHSQLRLGTEALNQYFVVNLGASYLGKSDLAPISSMAKDDSILMISGEETVKIDGININAGPSGIIKTPLLKVSQIDEQRTEYGRMIQYTIKDANGKSHKVDKPLKRKIRVGDQVRPIVGTEISLPSSLLLRDIALETLEQNDSAYGQLEISPDLIPGDLLVNTRTTQLLEKQAPKQAGYIEQLNMDNMQFPVKLDTGADVSSMHATNIKTFTDNGKEMVSFTYSNHQGDEKAYTREVVKTMRIKARDGEKPSSRYVVNMTVKLGNTEKEINVNLRDRSRFEYSIILGKNFLKNNIVVSSDAQFILTNKN